jgi:hypothetical protein
MNRVPTVLVMHFCFILQFAAARDDQNLKDVGFCKDGGVTLCTKKMRDTPFSSYQTVEE